MNNVITTEHLTQRFGDTLALNDFSFCVPEGSIYAFLGPNGAGKTTMIKTLVNILYAAQGKATVLGVDSRDIGTETLRQIGYVSENQEMPEWMTVEVFLKYCRSMYPKWDAKFCQAMTEQFEIPPDKTIRSLSRGTKMKVSLISSLAYRPQLLILDEPFSGLDPLARQEFINGVLEITENEHWTVFLSSHDIDEVDLLADWVGIIDKGALKLSEETEKLQSRFKWIEVAAENPIVQDERQLPKAWLLPRIEGRAVHFVHSQYEEGKSEQELKVYFAHITNVHVRSMSLKEIFLILAKQFKILNI